MAFGIPEPAKLAWVESLFHASYMNAGFIKLVSIAGAAAVFASGCSNMTPGENAALFGTIGGAAAGGIARAAGLGTAESLATGVATGAIIAATTYIIAKHQATERQRRVAEERARAAYAKIAARRNATTAQRTAGGGRKVAGRAKTAKKVPRYIAVDTVKDEKTSSKARKSVMIWDTESQQVVGNQVYDVQTPPPVGSTARFETYSAEYVGSGS
jgi:hypothetical protein